MLISFSQKHIKILHFSYLYRVSNHLYLSKLSLINFKNYEQADLSLSPDINCFIGQNGVGKTNVLDAIHYLSMCRSYMNPVDSQNILFDAPFFVIQSTWNKDNKDDTVYCGVKKGQKKVFKKNKVIYEKLADHVGQYPTVMISPYDRDLIVEGSEIRRKWIDSIISQFNRDFLNDSMKYKKVLAQRNALLKNVSHHGFFEVESMDVWDEQLVKYGQNIHEERKNAIESFIPIFKKYYHWISNNAEDVSLEYRSQLFENSLKELLQEARKDDLRRQFTTNGIHRDDFVFTIKGHQIKKFGSQGQQKSYLIALKLAQYEWLYSRLNQKPVLLLDDIFDKLDNERVERLMQMVSDQEFGQVLITDTDQERISSIFEKNKIEYKSFLVRENSIKEFQPKSVEI